MYKLLALDIDDTITLDPESAPERIVSAVERARRAGIRVTIATGRGYHGSHCIVKQLGISEPVINYGGAVISDPYDGRTIYGTEIAPELVHMALMDAVELGVHVQLYQGDTVICKQFDDYINAYSKLLHLDKREDPDIYTKEWHGVPKVLMMTTEELSAKIIPQLSEKYAGRLKVSGSSRGFIEINHPSSHKGAGLAWVAKHLGIAQADTVAVGDNSLDVEMLRWAGLGCAVANARDEIKAEADIVIPSCADCGVEWLVDNVLLKQ